jgi:hypothetical protein
MRGLHVSRNIQMAAVLLLAGLMLIWQLFIPPIIGLADQGDFVRVLGPLGYAPVPKGPEHKYWYLTRTYVRDPIYREPDWEQISSEMILARIAVAANALFGNPKAFDIVLFGAAHTLVFLLALTRPLYVTRRLAMYPLIWAAALLILTDVGYVAYWNSLYTEPASSIWFLFVLAESINLCQPDEVPRGAILRWALFAVLLVTAKIQNAVVCVPLLVYGMGMLRYAQDRKTRCAIFAGVVAIGLAGIVMYKTVPATTKVAALYNTVFYSILPDSQDPQADLRSLGLDPAYERYSGTLAWSPGTGVADGVLVHAIQDRVTSFGVVAFYFKRPGRMFRRLNALLPSALSLRPEFCGNFDRSAGRRPGARSDAIALWSQFHERCLSAIAPLLLTFLCIAIVGGSAALLFSKSLTPPFRRYTELAICLAACCLTAFAVAAFGDAYDNVKHQFLFNLLLDTCLVFGLVATFVCFRR